MLNEPVTYTETNLRMYTIKVLSQPIHKQKYDASLNVITLVCVQTSLGSVQTSLGSIQTSLGSVQTSLGSVQTSLGSVQTSLGSLGPALLQHSGTVVQKGLS